MIEHVTTSKQEDGDEADGRPDVAALDDGHGVGPGHKAGGYGTGDGNSSNDPFQPVDRSLDGRVWAVGKVAGEPLVNLLSRLRSVVLLASILAATVLCRVPMAEVVTDRLGRRGGMGASGGREEEEDRGGL